MGERGSGYRTFSKFLFYLYFFREFPANNYILQLLFAVYIYWYCERISTAVKVSCPLLLSLVMESTSLTTYSGYGRLHKHLSPFDMHQNNSMKFSGDRKNYIDFQLDVLGGEGRSTLKTSNGLFA